VPFGSISAPENPLKCSTCPVLEMCEQVGRGSIADAWLRNVGKFALGARSNTPEPAFLCPVLPLYAAFAQENGNDCGFGFSR